MHYAQSVYGGDAAPGEGAAVFVVENAESVRAAGRTPDAEVLSVEVGVFDPPGPDGEFSRGLGLCISRALERAGVTAADITTVATAANGMTLLDEGPSGCGSRRPPARRSAPLEPSSSPRCSPGTGRSPRGTASCR